MLAFSPFYRLLLGLAIAALLLACESEKTRDNDFARQQNLFLLSLDLVEDAGSQLQSPDLEQTAVVHAMRQMDQGLKLAFQVDMSFLKKLDIRLPRLYTEMFIKGVERYRLGVESSDRQQQLDGLNLLSQWSKFWLAEKAGIQNTLLKMSGSN